MHPIASRQSIGGRARASEAREAAPGALVLSEFAALARVLSAAVRCNPWSVRQVSGAIERALDQPDGTASGIDRTELPDTLEKFREWWMSAPSLADGALDRRVPPRGVAGAALMVLLPQPFDDDADGLLSGGARAFAEAMLRAMGLAAHEVYVASALPVPTAMPDWTRLAASGLGEVARHHIALAAPQRVLLFGRAQLELFGIARERAREPLSLDCAGKPHPLLAAPDLRNLARSAARRENFWNRWLDWTQ